MREIVLDTETTGLDPFSGDRIVEIGCVELVNHVPTGKTYHQYINPERSISQEVIDVHGLTEEFLADKPKFAEIADDFLKFVGNDSKFVIHNAAFDMKFLNAELSWCGREALSFDRVIDTLIMARQKFPGSRVNLNELCKRYNISLESRVLHGALLDSELLAQVYVELIGGKEPGLVFNKKEEKQMVNTTVERVFRPARVFEVSPEELAAHADFLSKIKNNLWSAS